MSNTEYMSSVPTPHISAKQGEIAKTVLMPGDPLRSKFIAESFLEGAVLVNNVRGVQGYTGTYHGTPVTVMASGMGMPSMGIYSHELFNLYGVDSIIRIGSAGSLQEFVHVRDLVLGMGACTNSNFGAHFGLGSGICPVCDFSLLTLAAEVAKEQKLSYHVGTLLTSDNFYDEQNGSLAWRKMGVLATEMEAAALYMNAMRAGKRALAICTVSDSLLTGECTTSEERQLTFVQMITLALEVAKRTKDKE